MQDKAAETVKPGVQQWVRRGILAVSILMFVAACATARAPAPKVEKIEPGKIVAFGDSTTAPRGGLKRPYAQVLADELPRRKYQVDVVNAGVGGNTTADARRRLEKDVLAKDPQLVIIQFGINDASVDVWKDPPATASRVSKKDYEANLRELVHKVRAQGGKVVLMTPNPMRWVPLMKKMYGKPPYKPDDPDGFNIILRDYAEIVRQIAKSEKVPLVDVYAAYEQYAKKPGQTMDSLLLDGVHPNDDGHKLVADMLIETIAGGEKPK
jgi:lysophospholipase L1-like esterase